MAVSFQPAVVAFAAGGFGGSGSKKAVKRKATQKPTTKKKKTAATTSSSSSSSSINTPQERMAYIQSRIQAADVSSLAELKLFPNSNTGDLVLDINPNGICVVDNFLNHPPLLAAMRQEAESLLPSMVPSQSTRWDDETQQVVPYEKVGVLSTQIEGGAQGYETTPRLVEYIVTLTQHLTHKLNTILPPNHQLDETQQTNKLAVCLGEGSKYDKHIDNLGGGQGDARKLTALLYLQPAGSHDGQPDYPNESDQDDPRGGYFRAYDVPEPDHMRHIAPRGDRLILFWSDALVHDVSPSFAPNGDQDRRWALTTWFVAAPNAVIRETDPAVEEKHFGSTTGKG